MTKPITAILLGAGLGFLLVIVGQKAMNAHETATCKRMADYHRLVTYTSFMGDAKYCIHISYLAQ